MIIIPAINDVTKVKQPMKDGCFQAADTDGEVLVTGVPSDPKTVVGLLEFSTDGGVTELANTLHKRLIEFLQVET